MPARRSGNEGRSGRSRKPGILRAAADELGVTTPKSVTRPRRKGPVRVAVYNAPKKKGD